METVTIHIAKTTLSQLLTRVEAGRKSCWRAASSLSPNSCRFIRSRRDDNLAQCVKWFR